MAFRGVSRRFEVFLFQPLTANGRFLLQIDCDSCLFRRKERTLLSCVSLLPCVCVSFIKHRLTSLSSESRCGS